VSSVFYQPRGEALSDRGTWEWICRDLLDKPR